MGTPVKRRKLNNDSKASPVAGRSLDYFFGKQRQTQLPNLEERSQKRDVQESDEQSDEQLARKLQDEWNKESRDESLVAPALGGKDVSATASNSNTPPISATEEELVVGTQGAVQELSKLKTQTPASQEHPRNTLALQSAGLAEDTTSVHIPLDTSPLTFDPSKFVPELQKHWSIEGGHASYALLTRCFVLVNATQSRIKIVDTLVNTLRVIIEGDPDSLVPAVRIFRTYIYLCFASTQIQTYIPVLICSIGVACY